MGRRTAAPDLVSHVRQLRTARGLAQGALARSAGLTRQAISSIESGHYVPNTAVALRLAAALHCRVEDLFALHKEPGGPDVELVSDATNGTRLALAHVGDRWLGYPLGAGLDLEVGFVQADALFNDVGNLDKRRGGIELLTAADRLEQTALILGCDPSLSILANHLASRDSGGCVRWLPASSQRALDGVARGEAHVAGTHLREQDGSGFNVSGARRALAHTGGLVVAFARWEQGLVVAPRNPKAIRGVADLARPDVRIVNREIGSGSRVLLDAALARERVPTEAVAGYAHSVGSHLAAAIAVASGGADAAIALRATARVFDLGFLALDEVRFDLVIPREHVTHSAVASLLEALQSARLRAEIASLPGYEVDMMGAVISDLPATAA